MASDPIVQEGKIAGVLIKRLRPIPDERGRVMEVLRADDPFFKKFGQAYVTVAYHGVVKAWHYHKVQTDHFTVLHGMAKLALYDDRADSKTRGVLQEFFLGDHNPILVTIPPGVYHGFKGLTDPETILLNIPTEPYNREKPDEHRLPAHDPRIPYDWSRKDG